VFTDLKPPADLTKPWRLKSSGTVQADFAENSCRVFSQTRRGCIEARRGIESDGRFALFGGSRPKGECIHTIEGQRARVPFNRQAPAAFTFTQCCHRPTLPRITMPPQIWWPDFSSLQYCGVELGNCRRISNACAQRQLTPVVGKRASRGAPKDFENGRTWNAQRFRNLASAGAAEPVFMRLRS
jgi:hypothetical protein